MEPEAQETVTHNGQTFTASDIKALLMIAYDATPAVMLGGRCNARELERNEEGRVTAEECRDVNAGAFHVVVTNMLGIHRRSFVEDRTTDYEVWNQPLRSYEITSLRDGLSASEAMSILGESGSTYAYNADAVSFADVRMRLSYITESSPSEGPRLGEIDYYTRSDYYHYILELDAHGDIIGGVWADESQLSHPDFLWLPTNHGTNFWSISYQNVQMLLEMSRNGGGGGGGGEGQVFETEPELAIPDNDSTGVTSRLAVNATGEISSLQVNVDISHTYIGDLTVRLRHNGQEVTLHRRQGGSADDIARSFDVSDFNGQDVSGDWELFVCDEAGIDVGTLHAWGLNVVTGGGGGGGGGGTGSTLTFASSGAVAIPDHDADGAESIINVSDSATIRSLRVGVNIEHTWIGDLIVELRHNGQVRRLHNRGGGSDDNIVSEFQVQEFNNSNIQGEWALFVSDNAGYDLGRIVEWELIAEVD
jgi:subtilisin-like proprotein convertase family protein